MPKKRCNFMFVTSSPVHVSSSTEPADPGQQSGSDHSRGDSTIESPPAHPLQARMFRTSSPIHGGFTHVPLGSPPFPPPLLMPDGMRNQVIVCSNATSSVPPSTSSTGRTELVVECVTVSLCILMFYLEAPYTYTGHE